jgi:hypothetical protein
MDIIKVIPWMLTALLAIVCWQQRGLIAVLEAEKVVLTKEVIQSTPKNLAGNSAGQLKRRAKTLKLSTEDSSLKQNSISGEQTGQDNPVSNYELEDIVEERAWERIEEIEEERRQDRFDRISERIQGRTGEWAKELDWSDETETSMTDILMSYIQDRIDLHEKLRNGEVERQNIRQIFQDKESQRNEEIIELIGEEQFTQLEDDLNHRGPRH